MTEPATAKKTWKDSFEYRSVKFLLRALGVMMFIFYLAAMVPNGWKWSHARWIQALPLSSLPDVANDYAQNRQPEKLAEWIALRPRSERQEIMDTLEPVTGKLPPAVFSIFSRWKMEEMRETEAVFWWQYTRYRLHYDALRCGSPTAVDKMKDFLEIHQDEHVQAYIKRHPEKIPADIRRVLDMDARFPAENNPVPTCKHLRDRNEVVNFTPAPPSEWKIIRHSLRMTTELSLKAMEQKTEQENKK
jgi:hypothetical protein